MVFQTQLVSARFNALFAHGLVAATYRIEILEEFKEGIHRRKMTIGPKVHSALAVYMSRLENTRQVLLGYCYIRITLSVFQEYIIARLELFDKLVFQKQRFGFGLYDGVVDVPNLRNKNSGFARVVIAIKIAGNAPLQVLSFTHINHCPVLVEILVASWRFGQTIKNGLEMLSARSHI